jgi:serine/threonine protein kinase
MGAVYLAVDIRLNRKLALKVMLPQFAANPVAKERFLREARATAQVAHDNIVTVYEADERDGVPYIAMQLLQGLSLDDYLKTKGILSVSQILRIGREAAAGLSAAHRRGLVHRDIKPANLWLEAPHGRVKLLDFGLARPADADAELTRSGAVVGTPAYMSPEQARGEKVDLRTDLFSLGAVLYRLVTGRRPFEAPTIIGVLTALATKEPLAVQQLNPAAPPGLVELIERLLAKNPQNRPVDADEVVKEIRCIARKEGMSRAMPGDAQSEAIAAGIQITLAPDLRLTSHFSPTRKKGRGMLYVVAFSILTMVAGLIIVIRHNDGSETKLSVADSASVTEMKNGALANEKASGATTDSNVDPDRRAAEWVLSIGGKVGIDDPTAYTEHATDLPKGQFRLTRVLLQSNEKVTDADLARFAECRNLKFLNLFLSNAQITDKGLAYFRNSEQLERLHLAGFDVTDAGLAHFQDRKQLTQLHLSGKGVTDAGLANFQGCANLAMLSLPNTAVTDAGLAH